jgi:hypothetical protein
VLTLPHVLALFLQTRQWQRRERAERLELMVRLGTLEAAAHGLRSDQIDTLTKRTWQEIRELREPEAAAERWELPPEMRRVLNPYEFLDESPP